MSVFREILRYAEGSDDDYQEPGDQDSYPLREVFYDFCHGDSELKFNYKDKPVTIKSIEQFGGEGCGDDYWIVFEVNYDGLTETWQRYGWYGSYVGHEWQGFRKVKPVEVMVTEWHKDEE